MMNEEDIKRITSSRIIDPDEKQIEESIRPRSLDEVIGRKREKENLRMMIDSAIKRDESLDHILLHGPPGLGKTSMALVIASELGVPMHITSGPAITKAGDLAAILTALEEKSILFIDEVHRLRHSVEEILYPAMEDGVIDIVIGKGPSAKTLRLDLPKFTIIAATTKLSMLSAPLRDRFGVDFRLDFYEDSELEEIVKQKAGRMNIKTTPEAEQLIATRSRMTARIAIRMLKRVRDLAVVQGVTQVNREMVMKVLEMLDIDNYGLDKTDRKIIEVMHYNFSGKPVGLSTLAASISTDTQTLEDVYEPYLLRMGIIERTPRGRMLTAKGLELVSNIIR